MAESKIVRKCFISSKLKNEIKIVLLNVDWIKLIANIKKHINFVC